MRLLSQWHRGLSSSSLVVPQELPVLHGHETRAMVHIPRSHEVHLMHSSCCSNTMLQMFTHALRFAGRIHSFIAHVHERLCGSKLFVWVFFLLVPTILLDWYRE